MQKLALGIGVLLLALAAFAVADTVTTTVFFNVPTAVSFTATLPSQGGVSSGSTASIEFNSSTGTGTQLNASVVGGGGFTQTAAIPIFNYTNTGTVPINLTLIFNASLPTGVTVKAANAVGGYQAACGGTVSTTTCANVAASAVTIVRNLAASAYNTTWLWADFVSVAGGTQTRLLTHTSLAAT